MPIAPLTAPPDVLRWSPRSQGNGDCVVTALEIACGVTYEQALEAAIRINGEQAIMKNGLNIRETRRVAEALGWQTKYRRKFDLSEDSGILFVDQKRFKDAEHAVYLWEGRILEPGFTKRSLWLSAESFISHYRMTVQGLLEIYKEEG